MSNVSQRVYNTDEEKRFDLLFRNTYPRVLAYLAKVSGQLEVAEDIAQNIYLQLWEKKTALPLTEKETLYYLFTIARHHFYQHTQKLLKEQQGKMSFTVVNDKKELLPVEPNSTFGEKEMMVAATLAGIEPVKTKYFLLNKEKGLSYRKIAEQEGVSAKTVMRYVNSVSKILRSKLTSLFFSLF